MSNYPGESNAPKEGGRAAGPSANDPDADRPQPNRNGISQRSQRPRRPRRGSPATQAVSNITKDTKNTKDTKAKTYISSFFVLFVPFVSFVIRPPDGGGIRILCDIQRI